MRSEEEDVAAAIERVEAACVDSSIDPGGRDDARDGVGDGWAHRAALTMLLGDVAESRVVEALGEVAAQVEASGEGPRELFGDPDAWVAERRARWREAGTEHVVQPRPGLLDLLGESLLTAAIISGLFVLYLLITWSWGDAVSVGMLLLPVGVGIIARAVQLVFTEVRSARSPGMGVLAAVGTTAVGAGAISAVVVLTRDTMLGGPGALWLIGLALVCTGLGAVLAVVAPERPERLPAVPKSEEEWFDALARALRERDDMTGARREEIVAESREHARDAGVAPQEEFGYPGAYAASFTGDSRLAGRRKAWISTVLALLVLVYVVASVADGSVSLWGLAWLLFAMGLAVTEWRAASRT